MEKGKPLTQYDWPYKKTKSHGKRSTYRKKMMERHKEGASISNAKDS